MLSKANIALFLALNGAGLAALEPLMQTLSWFGSYWRLPLYAAVLAAIALAFRLGHRHGAAYASAMAACRLLIAFAIAAPLTAALKQAVALPRPAVALDHVRVFSAADSMFSFPSGHAVFTGVLVASVWPWLPRWGRLLAVLFAASVGISRVWLGAHFPGDVVAGVLLGVFVAAWTGWLLRRLRTDMTTALAFGGVHPRRCNQDYDRTCSGGRRAYSGDHSTFPPHAHRVVAEHRACLGHQDRASRPGSIC